MEIDVAYLNEYEAHLQEDLLRLSTSYKMLEGVLLATDDIDEHWKQLAPEYIADAVEQIKDYPTVSLAWATYLGMAVAYGWDADWETYRTLPYTSFYGKSGFDDMDEHILQDLLGLTLETDETLQLEAMVRRCAQAALTMIRHEQIPPQSPMAFHVFARSVKVLFRVGAAFQLKRMGYKFEKVDL